MNRTSRLVAAAIMGFLALNYPLLALFDIEARVFGVPILWVYLFTIWALLIGFVAASTGDREDPGR